MVIPDTGAGFDIHTIILSVLGALGSGKLLLQLARTMPPPPASCGFWCRWFFDFIQQSAENQDKVGKTQALGQPIGIETPTRTDSKSITDVPAPTPLAGSAVPNEKGN